jgi:multiple sugar transport system substrate-binding protein
MSPAQEAAMIGRKLARRDVLKGTAAVALAAAAPRRARAQAPVEIEYWQYTFDQRIQAMNQLIEQFQAANPGIRVKHQNFPYAQYRAKVATAIPAGEGPEVVQLFYGWLDDYVRADLLKPLATDAFDPAVVDREFFPLVQTMKREGKYYGIPTAVRSLALIWNKALFRQAGLNPDQPPTTLDAYVEMAKRLTQRDAQGNLVVEGTTMAPEGQDLGWYREGLVRQFGGRPYSDDARRVMYNSDAGVAAMKWYTDLITVHRAGDVGFMQEQPAAFRANRAALSVDGSFRVGAYASTSGLEFGVAELPVHNNIKSNYASYWVNGISAKATGAKLEAAQKFLAFVTTADAMNLWLRVVGELPARVAAAMRPENVNHPQFGQFIKGLEYAVATRFVQEDQQRQVLMDAIDRIRLQHQPVPASIAAAAAEEQALLDRFYRG